MLGSTGSERIETLVVDLLERSEAAGDIVQGDDVGGAMLRLREFMFARVYLGPEAQREQQRIERMLRALFAHYAENLPAAADARRVRARARGGLPGRDDRPLRNQGVHRPVRAPGLLRCRRATPRTRSSGCARRWTSWPRSRATPTCGGWGRASPACARSTRSARPRSRSTPSVVSTTASAARRGETRSGWCRSSSRLDFPEAVEQLAERYGVELAREREDPHEEERRRRRERLLSLIDRTATFYCELSVGVGRGREGAQSIWSTASCRRRCCGHSGWATRRRRGTACWWRRGETASRDEELLGAGLVQRARNGNLMDRFRERIMFPLADSRGRVLGFGARAMRDEQGAKYINTSEGELYHKGRQLFGLDRARSRDRQGGPRGGRGGLHRRAGPARRRPRGERRDHGHRADQGAARRSCRARWATRARCTWRSTPTARASRPCSGPRG